MFHVRIMFLEFYYGYDNKNLSPVTDRQPEYSFSMLKRNTNNFPKDSCFDADKKIIVSRFYVKNTQFISHSLGIHKKFFVSLFFFFF